jgi:hypothetical protein
VIMLIDDDDDDAARIEALRLVAAPDTPAVSQSSPGRSSSATLIPRRVSGQDRRGNQAEVEVHGDPSQIRALNETASR